MPAGQRRRRTSAPRPPRPGARPGAAASSRSGATSPSSTSRRQVCGPGSRSWVPFPAALADELAALMEGKDRDALVFGDQRGGVLRNSNWRARVFGPAVDICRKEDDTFPVITPHDLRHTAASLAISAGANV